MQHSEILFDTLEGKNGAIGHIMLNRPQALNALTDNMCVEMHQKLEAWKHDPYIKAVLIQGAGEKAFCAGGDVLTAYAQRDINKSGKNPFFKDEYRLDAFVHHYPKPYLAIMHGITFGGGAGVSVHGKYRIATDTLKFAMPETGIGFFPDIGATYFLPRATGKTGWYIGLTGNVLNASDAIYAGLVDYHIPTEHISDFVLSLSNIHWGKGSENSLLENVIHDFHIAPPASIISNDIDQINICFSADSVEIILENLKKQHSDWSMKTYDILLTRSPTSLKVTLESLKRGSLLSFDECMKMEYKITSHFLLGHEFYEGIRAALIDKDKNPQWQPSELSQVSASDVLAYF